MRGYQVALSPTLHLLAGPGAGCRYWPSCSSYSLGCLRRHGLGRGLLLTLARLGRCHPWGGSGVDPVPPRRQWRAGLVGLHERK